MGQAVGSSGESLFRLSVVAGFHELLGESQVCERVSLVVSYHVVVGRNGFL